MCCDRTVFSGLCQMLSTEVKTCNSHYCWQAIAHVKAAWRSLEPYVYPCE